MLGASNTTGPRPPPTGNVDDLHRQLRTGEVEVNATVMSREKLVEWAKRLQASAENVKTLKILCVPRDIMWSQYHYSQLQEHSTGQHIFATKEHKTGVKIASANVQHHAVRATFVQALCAVLRQAPVEELVLGLRLTVSGCQQLSAALAANTGLKRLSFAGSHMGDERFMTLKPGLLSNCTLEELDLTSCDLTDEAARSVASIIKAHADRRMGLAFDEQLRLYPDTSLPPNRAHLTHHAQLRAIARSVDERCGGLLHLELAENKLTDKAARALCTALSYDRRLILLSLRANKLTAETESEFVALMKEHQALLRVDLRQNSDTELGILKLKRPRPNRVLSTTLGYATNPGSGSINSPTRTEDAGDSLGPTPTATPRHTFPSHISTVSWGDMHLLSRGSAPKDNPPQSPGGPASTAAARSKGGSSRGGALGSGGGGGARNTHMWWLQRLPSGRRRSGHTEAAAAAPGSGSDLISPAMSRQTSYTDMSRMTPGLAAARAGWGAGLVDGDGQAGSGAGGSGTSRLGPQAWVNGGGGSDPGVGVGGQRLAEGTNPNPMGMASALAAGSSLAATGFGAGPAAAGANVGRFGGPVGGQDGPMQQWWQEREATLSGEQLSPRGGEPSVRHDAHGVYDTPLRLKGGAATSGDDGTSEVTAGLVSAEGLEALLEGPTDAVGGGGGGDATVSAGAGYPMAVPPPPVLRGSFGFMAPTVPAMVSEPPGPAPPLVAAQPGSPAGPGAGGGVIALPSAVGGSPQYTLLAVPQGLGWHVTAVPSATPGAPPSGPGVSSWAPVWPTAQPGSMRVGGAGQRGGVGPGWLAVPLVGNGAGGLHAGSMAAGRGAAAVAIAAGSRGAQPQAAATAAATLAAAVAAAVAAGPGPGLAAPPFNSMDGLMRPGAGTGAGAVGLGGIAGPRGGASRGGIGIVAGGSTLGAAHGPAAGGGGGGGVDGVDAARQQAFLSMLHGEVLAGGERGYDHLFAHPGGRRNARSPPGAANGGNHFYDDSPRKVRRRVKVGRRSRATTKRRKASASTTPVGTRGTRRGASLARPLSREANSPSRFSSPTRTAPRHLTGHAKGRNMRVKRTGLNDPSRHLGSSTRNGTQRSTRGRGSSPSPWRHRRRQHSKRRRSKARAADPLSAAHPQALFVLERSLLQMAAEIEALEAATAARNAEEAAAAASTAERTLAAAERAAAAAEAAERAAVTAIDKAAEAERRARHAARKAKAAEAARAAKAAAEADEARRKELQRREEKKQKRLIQLAQASGVRQYESVTHGNGVTVNTIIEQLDRWCGLCDDVLLQPPESQPQYRDGLRYQQQRLVQEFMQQQQEPAKQEQANHTSRVFSPAELMGWEQPI